MNLFYQPNLSSHFQLSAEEAHHAIKVLRHQIGDTLQLTNGKGVFAIAVIEKMSRTECHCRLIDQQVGPTRTFTLHLAIAPTKNSDRMEWLIEKCVEMGIDRISFMTCQHSERKKVNLERLQKVALSAMKQSQQAWLPVLEESIAFEKVVSGDEEQRFIAHVDATNPLHIMQAATARKSTLILIGPEGDFSPEELQLAASRDLVKVSLGPNRLRTETAGLYACCVLNALNCQ